MNKASAPSYPSSLKLFIDAGNPLSYSGSGTTVTDLIGTQNGTLVNGVGYNAGNGGHFTFDGVNDFIEFGINSLLRTTERTVSIWGFVDNTSSTGTFLSDISLSGYKGSAIYFDAGGYKLELDYTSSYQVFSTGNTTKGVWYYLTASYNGSTVKFYINGTLIVNATQNLAYINNNDSPTYIGKYFNSLPIYLKGKVAQMKIYNVAQSGAEVLTDFNEFKARYGY